MKESSPEAQAAREKAEAEKEVRAAAERERVRSTYTSEAHGLSIKIACTGVLARCSPSCLQLPVSQSSACATVSLTLLGLPP